MTNTSKQSNSPTLGQFHPTNSNRNARDAIVAMRGMWAWAWHLSRVLIGLILLASPAWGTAQLLPNGKVQFFNGAGVPLSGGKVFTYIPNTTSPANTWQDPNQTILNSNPIILDGSGMAVIWGAGNYRQVVQDVNGVNQWDQLAFAPAGQIDVQNSSYTWGGNATGTGNNFIISVSPPLAGYVAGQAFRFVANQTITGPPTLNVNGNGAVQITKFGTSSLVAGDIISGSIVAVTFDGSRFQLASLPAVILTAGVGLVSSATVLGLDPTYVQGYLGGLTLSNDGGSPNTVIDIAAGEATSDDVTTLMKVGSAVTKTTGAWTLGTGNGCLDAGVVTTSTWYHVFVIERTDTKVVDELCSTSAIGPVLPANYTKQRRIGAFKTDNAVANILAFTQDGDYFRWAANVAELNRTNPGAAAVTLTLGGVPLGVNVQAVVDWVLIQSDANAIELLISDFAANDVAATTSNATLMVPSIASGAATAGQIMTRTNTSAQVRYRVSASNGNTLVNGSTIGWWDTRGRFK